VHLRFLLYAFRFMLSTFRFKLYALSFDMRTVVPAFLLLMLSSIGFAQETFKARPSPLAIAAMRYKDAYVKIVYSQPQKRNREIFGKLVPFGQVWRLGANEATEITITKDILINAILVKAGTYSLFAIPNADKWTLILNSDVGIWGAYNYNQKLDVLRFDLPVKASPTAVESFTMAFDQKNDLANLLITWDKLRLEIPFKFIN
jgi:hypothetical protein